MKLHTLKMNPALRKYRKTIEAVPNDKLNLWSIRLFSLLNLAWDYIDTLCEIAVMQRRDLKAETRRIRQLKREYDKFREGIVDGDFMSMETNHGLGIEQEFAADFTRMNLSISNEIGKYHLSAEDKDLAIAATQAQILMDAAKIYARRCDKWIIEYDVWVCDCCMIQSEFLALYDIVPKFLQCIKSKPDMTEARKINAVIIANKIEKFGEIVELF